MQTDCTKSPLLIRTPIGPTLILSLLLLLNITHTSAKGATGSQSNGLKFVPVPAGKFVMGADLDPVYINADKEKNWRSIFIQDEFPVRNITISNAFEITEIEITNAQYERFDPDHQSWRGHFMGLSTEDDEAVVYVSWKEAVAYTQWLSQNDPIYDYRLPTEAEWEYAARAGSGTPFNNNQSGDIYNLTPFDSAQREQRAYQWPYPFTYTNGCRSWVPWVPQNCTGVEDVYPDKHHIRDVDLTVGKQGPNAFGIYDMHGGVEEWVLDWYGPYDLSDTIDPAGYEEGDFKVTRGGSHNNHIQHMRSANRMSAAVNDKHYFLGFRVVRIRKDAVRAPFNSNKQPVRPWAQNVSQQNYQWAEDSETPQFSMTNLYKLVPEKSDGSHYGSAVQLRQFGFDPEKGKPTLTGPLYTHNHSPTICWAQNGDILVSWFSGESEIGPELTLLACRGRRQSDGSLQWTAPAEFLKAADRNMHSSNLISSVSGIAGNHDSEFTIHQMASIGVSGRWDKLALGYRKSSDNGASWSPVEMVLELDHGLNHGAQMQGNMLQRADGSLIFVTDDASDSISGTSSLVVSHDGGQSWERRGHSSNTPGDQRIAGIHAALAEIEDGNGDGNPDLLALGRDYGRNFDGKAPQSISTDGGTTWTRSPSVFPAIGTGRRMALMRLAYSNSKDYNLPEAPLLLISFAGDSIQAKDGEGKINQVSGLYGALSFDHGKTWPPEYRRVISNLTGINSKEIGIAPWQRKSVLTKITGQQEGYMSATQTPDGLIYITDGKMVYAFNLSWLLE